MRANYNARSCGGERNAAGAETMKNNEKTIRETIEKHCAKPWNRSPANSGMAGDSRPYKDNRPPPRGAGRGFPSLEFLP